VTFPLSSINRTIFAAERVCFLWRSNYTFKRYFFRYSNFKRTFPANVALYVSTGWTAKRSGYNRNSKCARKQQDRNNVVFIKVGDLFLSSLPVESFSPFFFPVCQVIRTIRKISLRPPDPPNFHRLALSCSNEVSSEQRPIQSQVHLFMCPCLSPRNSKPNGHNTVFLAMASPKANKTFEI